MKVDEAKYSVAEILDWMRSKELVANNEYQRGGGLWPNAAKSYFIDTILREFPFPKVYFYERIDKETKKPKREIVDGQQRLSTILDFVDGNFALGKNAREFEGKFFGDLEPDTQDVFLAYIGTSTVSGVVIPPLPQATSVELVSGAVLRARNPTPSANYWGAPPNATLRFEPTWGDVDMLNRIIPRLAPSNHAQILAAVSYASPNAKILQKIRNAAAHRNTQTMAEVIGLSSGFIAFPITDPTHALFWQEPGSGSFTINYTISELKAAAAAMAA